MFTAAGLYNVLWGLWSIADPQWFFRFTAMPLSNHPAMFACLGMVVGLYGVLYFEVARVPEHGWLIAAVGLTGKLPGRHVLVDRHRNSVPIWAPCAPSVR